MPALPWARRKCGDRPAVVPCWVVEIESCVTFIAIVHPSEGFSSAAECAVSRRRRRGACSREGGGDGTSSRCWRWEGGVPVTKDCQKDAAAVDNHYPGPGPFFSFVLYFPCKKKERGRDSYAAYHCHPTNSTAILNPRATQPALVTSICTPPQQSKCPVTFPTPGSCWTGGREVLVAGLAARCRPTRRWTERGTSGHMR